MLVHVPTVGLIIFLSYVIPGFLGSLLIKCRLISVTGKDMQKIIVFHVFIEHAH